MKRSVREAYQDAVHPELIVVRRSISDYLEDPSLLGTLGIKIWVLPSWYFAAVVKERENILTITDWLTQSPLVRPRMLRLGELQGGEPKRSRTRWAIGKGLIGQAMYGDNKSGCAVVRAHLWPTDISTYRRADLVKLGQETVAGRKPKDMGRLRAIYSSAVATALRTSPTAQPFGCITAHTPAGEPLSEDGEYVCGEYLKIAAVRIAELILELPHHAVAAQPQTD